MTPSPFRPLQVLSLALLSVAQASAQEPEKGAIASFIPTLTLVEWSSLFLFSLLVAAVAAWLIFRGQIEHKSPAKASKVASIWGGIIAMVLIIGTPFAAGSAIRYLFEGSTAASTNSKPANTEKPSTGAKPANDKGGDF